MSRLSFHVDGTVIADKFPAWLGESIAVYLRAGRNVTDRCRVERLHCLNAGWTADPDRSADRRGAICENCGFSRVLSLFPASNTFAHLPQLSCLPVPLASSIGRLRGNRFVGNTGTAYLPRFIIH